MINRAKGRRRDTPASGKIKSGTPKTRPRVYREKTALAKEEEHILRCLGAAVIMQWNDLPRDVQRELFESAIAMGEPRLTLRLKGRISRFLHKHEAD
jgi:hypothetical protein